MGSFLEKAWNHMKGAFEMFIDWVENLGKTTKDIEKLLKDANG